MLKWTGTSKLMMGHDGPTFKAHSTAQPCPCKIGLWCGMNRGNFFIGRAGPAYKICGMDRPSPQPAWA